MADILFHYPLNRLLQRIKNERIDGSQLIESLTRTSTNSKLEHQLHIREIIAKETGWVPNEVRQILLVLFRHHTWTKSEFTHNMDRIWAKYQNALLPDRQLAPQTKRSYFPQILYIG
eukprot:1060145_1